MSARGSCVHLGTVDRAGLPFEWVAVPSLWAAAGLLAQDAGSASDVCEVRALSDAIAWSIAPAGGPFGAWDAVSVVQLWVQQHVRYAADGVCEVFRSPAALLRDGAGDCDCHARLVLSILRALGVDGELWFFGTERDPEHVCCAAVIDGARVWCETTLAAGLGEHPYAAFWRLGKTR